MKEHLSSSSVWSSIGQKLHKNKKNLISVLLFLLLAALTFSAICKGNDMTEVAKAVRKMDAWYLFGAMGLGIFFVSAEGLMICYLLRALGNPIAAGRCIKYSFIGFFYSGITPSATGGQPMQLYHMKKDGLKMSESTVVLMTVAVLYKFVLVVIGLFMLLFGYHPLKNYLGSYMWLFYLGLLLNTVLDVRAKAVSQYCDRSRAVLRTVSPAETLGGTNRKTLRICGKIPGDGAVFCRT